MQIECFRLCGSSLRNGFPSLMGVEVMAVCRIAKFLHIRHLWLHSDGIRRCRFFLLVVVRARFNRIQLFDKKRKCDVTLWPPLRPGKPPESARNVSETLILVFWLCFELLNLSQYKTATRRRESEQWLSDKDSE